MDLTRSYAAAVPSAVADRYDWVEVRNAASVIGNTNPAEFADVLDVLGSFRLVIDRDILPAGGNESMTAAHLNQQFRMRGWREGAYHVRIESALRLLPWAEAGEAEGTEVVTEVASPSYLVDNVRGRVALDIEWHAKDGNLSRDIAAYRALYDAAIIDGAVMVTMTRADLRRMVVDLAPESTKWKTTTTTNLEKVTPLLTRGDGGGCPILVASICSRTR
jgi:hypothetical protein